MEEEIRLKELLEFCRYNDEHPKENALGINNLVFDVIDELKISIRKEKIKKLNDISNRS